MKNSQGLSNRFTGVIESRSIMLFAGFVAVLAFTACSSEKVDTQATIDAAVSETVTSIPTPTPDIQATVDAAIEATSQVRSDVGSTATAQSDDTASALRFDEEQLRSLLGEDDIPNTLYGDEIQSSIFTDLAQLAPSSVAVGASGFTGLTWQGQTTTLSLQVLDYGVGSDLTDELAIEASSAGYSATQNSIGEASYRFTGMEVTGITFAAHGAVFTILFQGSSVGETELQALEEMATLVASRL